jgi:hypothetical protein
MNKLFRRIGTGFAFLWSIAAIGVSDETPVPVDPTVFFLSREADPYRASKEEIPTLANIQLIIDAARKILKLDPYPSKFFENIIILDEGDNWFVSFHARGNGNVRFLNPKSNHDATDASGYFSVNPNAGVYLTKSNLAAIHHSLEKPIRSLPLISPMGEKIQGLGYIEKF